LVGGGWKKNGNRNPASKGASEERRIENDPPLRSSRIFAAFYEKKINQGEVKTPDRRTTIGRVEVLTQGGKKGGRMKKSGIDWK